MFSYTMWENMLGQENMVKLLQEDSMHKKILIKSVTQVKVVQLQTEKPTGGCPAPAQGARGRVGEEQGRGRGAGRHLLDKDHVYKVLYVFGEEYVRDIYSKVCRAKDNAREEVLELRLKLKDLEASLARRKEVGAADLYSSVVLMMISRDG